MKHLLAITIALLPSAVLAHQFTPRQMLEVMTKSPSNRDVRVHDDVDCGADEELEGVAGGRRDLPEALPEESIIE